MTYQKFISVLEKLGRPAEALDGPKTVADLCKTTFSPSEFLVPSLEELKVVTSNLGPHLYLGGETESLNRLEKYMKKQVTIEIEANYGLDRKSQFFHQDWICKFSKPDTSPNSLEPSTTVLSPYLKFGCLSPRLMYHRILQVRWSTVYDVLFQSRSLHLLTS